MERVRITRVDEKFYKLELLETKGAYADVSARAVRRALSISGLTRKEFFGAALEKLGITTREAEALFFQGRRENLDRAAQAVLDGQIVPCFDFILVCAELADTTVEVLLDERPVIDQVRSLIATVNATLASAHGGSAGTTLVS